MPVTVVFMINPLSCLYVRAVKPSQYKIKSIVGAMDKKFVEQHCPPPSNKVLLLVCGPPAMIKAVAGPKNEDFSQGTLAGVLGELGYKPDQVYKF